MTSSFAVSGFIATRKSISFLRETYPLAFARIVYQVGRPAIFDGNRFLPETGIPIWKMERSRTRFAVWLPDPLTVATWMLKSLTMRDDPAFAAGCWLDGLEGIAVILSCSSGGKQLTLQRL